MKILVDKNMFIDLVSKYRVGSVQKVASFKRTNYYVLIFSKGCLMRRANGRLENVVFTDGEPKQFKFKEHDFIYDTSSVTYVTNSDFQLPTQVTELPITCLTYKLYKNSAVSLNYEMTGNGVIRDAWFEIDDGYVDNALAMEDIDTFLQQ